MDIWVVSTFWLLWIMWLWTSMCKLLCGHMFSVLLDLYPWVKLLLCGNSVLSFEKLSYCFSKQLHVLHFHQWCMRVLISLHLCQHLFCFFNILFQYCFGSFGSLEVLYPPLCIFPSSLILSQAFCQVVDTSLFPPIKHSIHCPSFPCCCTALHVTALWFCNSVPGQMGHDVRSLYPLWTVQVYFLF